MTSAAAFTVQKLIFQILGGKLPDGRPVRDFETKKIASLLFMMRGNIYSNEYTIAQMEKINAYNPLTDDGGLLAWETIQQGFAIMRAHKELASFYPLELRRLLPILDTVVSLKTRSHIQKTFNEFLEVISALCTFSSSEDQKKLCDLKAGLNQSLAGPAVQRSIKNYEDNILKAGLEFNRRSGKAQFNSGGRPGRTIIRVMKILAAQCQPGFRQRTGCNEERPLELRTQVGLLLSEIVSEEYCNPSSQLMYNALKPPRYQKKRHVLPTVAGEGKEFLGS